MSHSDEVYDTHNRKTLSTLCPGDLVKFDRPNFYHWGVYVGDGEVIHLIGGSNLSDDDWKRYVSGKKYDRSEVRIDKFMDVARGRFAYKDNTRDKRYPPLPVEKIVKRAREQVGESEYNFLHRNCEHFATGCRYGKEMSDQADPVVKTSNYFGVSK